MSDSQGFAEELKDLYENAPCGYLSFLDDGKIIQLNQTLLDWLGRERSDIVSKMTFQDLIPVGEQILFETQVSPLLQMQGAAQEIQFNLVSRERGRLPVLTTLKRHPATNIRPAISRMALFQISQRKKFEAELKLERKRAEMTAKSKTDFLSMLSHEIRTALNAVIGVSNLLESTTLSPEQIPFINMLKNSSNNLLDLLNSILDLSKIESGKIVLEKKEFRLRKFLEGNALAWRGLAQFKGIAIVTDVEDAIPESAVGDPIKITQILSNLIGNALKFTEKGRIVLRAKLVALRNGEMTLRFEVQDTGIGIAPERLELIFEEFSQAEVDIALKFGGTGLGLTISQRLANLYGSRIEVQSEPGRGSVFGFNLTLPIGNPAADTHGIELVANQVNSLRGLSVLLADDSDDNQMLMKHLFKKWGAAVDTAKDGHEALEKVKAADFDVVLMDVRMPLMNGYEAALEIRKLPQIQKRDVPIVAFSGSTSFEGHELTDDSVFNAVIGKPFKPVELIETLLHYVKREN